MTEQELQGRTERSHQDALVMAPTEDGIRVYAAADPKKSYLVSGLPEQPHCTCPDFRLHAADPDWQCKHILAVRDRFFGGTPATEESHETEERRAIQEEARTPRRRTTTPRNGTPSAQMLLKRSVSPDGRIDSLSVEFSCPVADVPDDVKARARELLALQGEIMGDFLKSHPGKANGANGAPQPSSDSLKSPAVPARLVGIGGMDGKWGRRLFITVEVNGTTTRLFGNKKQLGDALIAAGYAGFAAHIAEGTSLNVPCRVVTKPSDDGRYLNVERVLPPDGNG
jgi:hypothetical protein